MSWPLTSAIFPFLALFHLSCCTEDITFSRREIASNLDGMDFVIEIADLNGDGMLDVVLGSSSGLSWFDNQSADNTNFTMHVISNGNVSDVSLVNLNDDLGIDVLVVESGEMLAYANNDGAFNTSILFESDVTGLVSTSIDTLSNGTATDLYGAFFDSSSSTAYIHKFSSDGELVQTLSSLPSEPFGRISDLALVDWFHDDEREFAMIVPDRIDSFSVGVPFGSSFAQLSSDESIIAIHQVVDLNEDSREDLLVTEVNDTGVSHISWIINAGDAVVNKTMLAPGDFAAAGCIDAETLVDVVVGASDGRLTLYRHDDSVGTFLDVGFEVDPNVIAVAGVAIADMDNDGRPDIVAIVKTESSDSTWSLELYRNALSTPAPTPMPTPTPTALPTPTPTALPTPLPTGSPSAIPTALPTPSPTALPTSLPTGSPSPIPTALPTHSPSPLATFVPTLVPNTSLSLETTVAPMPTETTNGPDADQVYIIAGIGIFLVILCVVSFGICRRRFHKPTSSSETSRPAAKRTIGEHALTDYELALTDYKPQMNTQVGARKLMDSKNTSHNSPDSTGSGEGDQKVTMDTGLLSNSKRKVPLSDASAIDSPVYVDNAPTGDSAQNESAYALADDTETLPPVPHPGTPPAPPLGHGTLVPSRGLSPPVYETASALSPSIEKDNAPAGNSALNERACALSNDTETFPPVQPPEDAKEEASGSTEGCRRRSIDARRCSPPQSEPARATRRPLKGNDNAPAGNSALNERACALANDTETLPHMPHIEARTPLEDDTLAASASVEGCRKRSIDADRRPPPRYESVRAALLPSDIPSPLPPREYVSADAAIGQSGIVEECLRPYVDTDPLPPPDYEPTDDAQGRS